MQIILLPFIVFLPINIISILISSQTIRTTAKEALSDNTGVIKIVASQLSNTMNNAENELGNISNNSAEYQYLSDMSKGDHSVKVVKARNLIIEDMKNYISWNSQIGGVWSTFHNSDETLLRYRTNTRDNIDEIRTYMKNWETGDKKQNWSLKSEADGSYLVYVCHLENSVCGAWISLQDVLSSIIPSHSKNLYYIFDSEYGNTLNIEPAQLSDKSEVKNDGKDYYTVSEKLEGWNFYVGELILQQEIRNLIPISQWIILFVSIGVLCITPFILYWLYRKMVRPLRQLHSAMEEVATGNTDYRIAMQTVPGERVNEMQYLLLHFNQMMDDLTAVKLNLLNEQIRQQKTRLRYLSQQIRPHFILNALNIIYMYEDDDFPEAKKLILYLTKYFRYIISIKGDWAHLYDEMYHVENYLMIQKQRYSKKFDYYINWEKGMENEWIPPLVIQTFAENCIKHALLNDRKIAIFISAKKTQEGNIQLMISDSGSGFPPETLEEIGNFIQKRQNVPDSVKGIGILNEIEYLDILYEKQEKISIRNLEEGGAEILLIFPHISDEKGGKADNV